MKGKVFTVVLAALFALSVLSLSQISEKGSLHKTKQLLSAKQVPAQALIEKGRLSNSSAEQKLSFRNYIDPTPDPPYPRPKPTT